MFSHFSKPLIFCMVVSAAGIAEATPLLEASEGRGESCRIRTNALNLPVNDEAGNQTEYTRDELQRLQRFQAKEEQSPDVPTVEELTTTPVTRPLWTFPILSSGLGLNLWAGTTSDSTLEIYVGSGNDFDGNRYWVALTVNAETGTYDPFFVSQDFTSRIKELLVGDVTGDPEKEIVVLTGNGEVHVYDQLSKEWIKSYGTVSAATAMRLHDLYGSGQLEVVVCNASSTAVYADGFPLWSVPAGGEDLTINQMDDDPGPEIALSSGKVVDATIRFVQWDRGTPFGVRMHSNDFDGDGMAEVIAAEAWYNVRAFDVDTQQVKWTVPVELDITALALTDVDNNGSVEVAIGEGQWGDVYAIDPVTTAQKYLVPNPNHGVGGIAMADVDSDGAQDLIWTGGFSSTGPDSLFIANPVTKEIKFTNKHFDGPFIGPVKGDLDGDGVDEIVAAVLEQTSWYDYYRLLVFDDYSLKLRAISPPMAGGDASEGYADLQLRDMDNDGQLEILFCTDLHLHGIIEAYEFDTSNTLTRCWDSPQLHFMPYTAVDAVDIDGDGGMEIIAGNSRISSSTTGTCLRVIDYATSTVEWSSPHLGGFSSRIGDVAVGQLDAIPGAELLALVYSDDVFIYDGITKVLRGTVVGSFRCMDIKDNYVFVADGAGNVRGYAYDGTAYVQVIPTVRVVVGPIEGMQVINANPLELTFGSAGRLMYYANGTVQSQSVSYGAPYGARYADYVSGGLHCLGANKLPPPELDPEPEQTSGITNQVSWKRVLSAARYQVEMDTTDGFMAPSSSGWISDTSFSFGPLAPGQTYYYRVKARASDGATESAWSRPQSSTQEPPRSAVSNWTIY